MGRARGSFRDKGVTGVHDKKPKRILSLPKWVGEGEYDKLFMVQENQPLFIREEGGVEELELRFCCPL